MFESISKKSFIELLKKHENELIFSRLSLSEKASIKIMDLLYNGTFEVKHGRKCIAINTNSITFTGGSKLYFDTDAKYFKHNNIIIQYKENYDLFDELYYYSIIAYVINN